MNNILNEFFNSRSDANKYLTASRQEELEADFFEWYKKAYPECDHMEDCDDLLEPMYNSDGSFSHYQCSNCGLTYNSKEEALK